MSQKILSNIILLDKNSVNFDNIEKELQNICNGKIIRFAIIAVNGNNYKVSYSYKFEK